MKFFSDIFCMPFIPLYIVYLPGFLPNKPRHNLLFCTYIFLDLSRIIVYNNFENLCCPRAFALFAHHQGFLYLTVIIGRFLPPFDIRKRGNLFVPKEKPSVGRILITAVNLILIVLLLLLSALLALSSLKGGTFDLFGKSWHYYQSDVMTGEVERGEMLVINRDSPVTFHPDDIVAFYVTDSKGSRVIQIARLMASEGTLYQLTEETGESFVVDSTETVFIGRVTRHSKLLGRLVQQMQTSDGRKIYLSWSVALLMLACGITVLLHVQKERSRPLPEDDADGYYDQDYYDDSYYEDEDYPEEEDGMQLRNIPVNAPQQPAYDYDYDEGDDGYEPYDAYEEEPEEPAPGYVDEDNMNLIAASTESEDEEEVDFEAIFREIRRQTKE